MDGRTPIVYRVLYDQTVTNKRTNERVDTSAAGPDHEEHAGVDAGEGGKVERVGVVRRRDGEVPPQVPVREGDARVVRLTPRHELKFRKEKNLKPVFDHVFERF